MAVRFDRSLEKAFLEQLKPSGSLKWLPGLCTGNQVGWALDPHFRERQGQRGEKTSAEARPGGDSFAFYYGTTKLLNARWSDGKPERVTFSAEGQHRARDEAGAKFLGSYALDQTSAPEAKAREYLAAAMAGAKDSYFVPSKEGYWQNWLSWHFGAQWSRQSEFLVVDRESVLGFDSSSEKEDFYRDSNRRYLELAEAIHRDNSPRFSKPIKGTDDGKRRGFGDELDLLAIDRDGRLVCIELKHRDNSTGVYWAPLQVLMYRDAYRKAAAAVHAGVTEMVRQKVELGLLPPAAQHAVPKKPWSADDVTAVVAVAQPGTESGRWDAWKALEIVQQSLGEEKVPVMLVDEQGGQVQTSWHPRWPYRARAS